MTELLQQGIAAARAGRKEEARALLLKVVQADERSEQGWLWLSGVMSDPEDIRTCLHNVLELNPANQQAQQGLAWVDQRFGPAPAPAAKPAAPPPPPEPAVSARAEPRPAAGERTISETYAGRITHREPEPPSPARPEPRPPVAPPAPAPVAKPALPAIAAPAGSVENPCPYCGAPTALAQKRCTQCRNDLMVRAAPAAESSSALRTLATLWSAGGVLMLVVTVLLAVAFLLALRAPRPTGASDQILLSVAAALALGMFYISVARGLRTRQRWAYYVNIALAILNLFGAFALLAGAALIGLILGSFGSRAPGTIALVIALLFGLAFALLPLVLTALSYGDFFGPTVRFSPAVEETDHVGHYNNGIAYRNRGMWYMAAQEWETAARKKREPNYLHALGLAYAQLRRFDQARATLDAALLAAPDNAQIKESRALVDQLAAQGAR
jgi:tetratricopeptide (TPR) repeat protein